MTVLQNNPNDRENTIRHEIGSIVDTRGDESTPPEVANAHSRAHSVTIEELERGILDAVRLGLSDVAKTLSGQLDARKASLMPQNVVALVPRRA
jgi:hypothetical protein